MPIGKNAVTLKQLYALREQVRALEKALIMRLLQVKPA